MGKKIYFVMPLRRGRRSIPRYSTQQRRGILGNMFNQIGLEKRGKDIYVINEVDVSNPKTKAIAKVLAKQVGC